MVYQYFWLPKTKLLVRICSTGFHWWWTKRKAEAKKEIWIHCLFQNRSIHFVFSPFPTSSILISFHFAWSNYVNIFLFLVRIFWLRVSFCAVRGVQCVMSQFFCRIGKTHLTYVTAVNGIALSLACSKLLHTFMDIVDTFSQKKSVFINGRTHVYLLYWLLYC